MAGGWLLPEDGDDAEGWAGVTHAPELARTVPAGHEATVCEPLDRCAGVVAPRGVVVVAGGAAVWTFSCGAVGAVPAE